EGGRPVQDTDPVTVTEEVERVEVAVAEHHVVLRGRLVSQRVEGGDEVGAPGDVGAGPEVKPQLVHGQGDAGRDGAGALHDGGRVDVVDGGHRVCESGGEAGQDA